MGRAKDEIDRAAIAQARESAALAAIEHRRLARARTLLGVAKGKIDRLPDNHPLRRSMEHRLNSIGDKLRSQEREASA